jgi:mRNA interferase RelE/StbE
VAPNQAKACLKMSDDTAGMIRHSHPQLKQKLRDALRMIINDPCCGKTLKEELKGLRSLRVGSIRIIYATTEQNIIEIVTIGPRRIIYEETYKLISQEERK